MNLAGVEDCLAAGADILGFVVQYPIPVPWNLTLAQAAALLRQLPSSCKSCVVTGGPAEQVVSLAKHLRPTMIQLHYRETPDEAAAIVRHLKPLQIQVVKALAPAPSLVEMGCAFQQAGVNALLLDPRQASNVAVACREHVDFQSFRQLRQAVNIPLWLAGGLTPSNVRAAIALCQPDGVDVLSAVETAPGRKSPEKVAAFVKAVKSATL